MNDLPGYAVFFFPNALEALGDAIKPYIQDGPAGPHVPCSEVDTGGAFVELTLQGKVPDGRNVALELMVPSSMVRMIVSARTDGSFGFTPRLPAAASLQTEPEAAAEAPPAAALPAPEAADAPASAGDAGTADTPA